MPYSSLVGPPLLGGRSCSQVVIVKTFHLLFVLRDLLGHRSLLFHQIRPILSLNAKHLVSAILLWHLRRYWLTGERTVASVAEVRIWILMLRRRRRHWIGMWLLRARRLLSLLHDHARRLIRREVSKLRLLELLAGLVRRARDAGGGVQARALLLFAREIDVAHSKRTTLREIVLATALNDVDELMVFVANWNDEFASDLQLLEQVLGNLLCSCADMDGIVRSLCCIAGSPIAADHFDAAIAHGGAIRPVQVDYR